MDLEFDPVLVRLLQILELRRDELLEELILEDVEWGLRGCN
jgi:hypothetical protein